MFSIVNFLEIMRNHWLSSAPKFSNNGTSMIVYLGISSTFCNHVAEGSPTCSTILASVLV